MVIAKFANAYLHHADVVCARGELRDKCTDALLEDRRLSAFEATETEGRGKAHVYGA